MTPTWVPLRSNPAPLRRRLVAVAALALLVAACASGPPEPLERPPGADMPAWVVDSYQPRTPLPAEDVAREEDVPQTQPAGDRVPPPRVPERITAVGQARHEDPETAEQLARTDAERALTQMLDMRIRRAFLSHIETLDGLDVVERDSLRGRVWHLDLAETIAALPMTVRHTAWDEPPEVRGPPVTFAEAVVPFDAVLNAAHSVAKAELKPVAPGRERLAVLLSQPR